MILLSVNVEVASPTLGIIIGTVEAYEQKSYEVLMKLRFKKESGLIDFKYDFVRQDSHDLISKLKPMADVLIDFYLSGMMMEERPSVWIAEEGDYVDHGLIPSDGYMMIKKNTVA